MVSPDGSRQPLSELLRGPPPVNLPCKPTLLLGVPDSVIAELSHVLINDLVFASTSCYSSPPDVTSRLEVLQFLDGKSLLNLTREYGGSVIISEDEVLDQSTGEVDLKKLNTLKKQEYQAIVVDDTSFIREPEVSQFVQSQFEKGVSVIVMGIEGIYDLSRLRESLDVDWQLRNYTSRTIQLTEAGKRLLGRDAFPFDSKYIKANLVVGSDELFAEYVNPADYEDDSDYEDGPPAPNPGSPVVTAVRGNKSVSYFGFVNSMDVSYGAIILRLCYAAQHSSNAAAGAVGERDEAASTERAAALEADDPQLSYWEWYVALVVRVFGEIVGGKEKAD
mmetsp:Transcript_30649/g.50632  ORF Transcript_30649/g.50632 Transcript_30649/m.50632 type:complete len:334 (+) Transcript_30649:20-1021(+)|eukprot:CAMPEP_0119027770 /NCGR_PEP_ID=MMETSP1176-20130426/37736_1 /TAXON_ID=265551 /ORGANISM="Synedropsis recta cf, Strain CCMP1620" /LENGTH=333 /DNA_ID=CAMNT_0006983761 /DNA_START=12 /DNA_END=1013 /DNA_ORIENTATION=-